MSLDCHSNKIFNIYITYICKIDYVHIYKLFINLLISLTLTVLRADLNGTIF